MTRFGPARSYDVSYEDVEYGGPEGEALLARVYRPIGAEGPLPALVDALRPHAPEYGTMPVRGAGPRAIDAAVAYALPLWPIADPLARCRYLLERRADPRPARDPFFQLDRLLAGHDAFFGDEETMARASVPRILEAGEAERLPPIWVAHPELDENVTLPMTERLIEAYCRAGGIAELEVFPGVGHAFANVPGDAADRCLARMRRLIA